MSREFARRKDGLNAKVCKDVPPKYIRKHPKRYRPIQVVNYQKIVIKIPDEYAFALTEMYKKGLQGAIMEHLRKTVNPVDLEEH